MGRSVRVAAIAAAMLFSLPAAAFADSPAPVVTPVAAVQDCPPGGGGPVGGSASGDPSTAGERGPGDDAGADDAPAGDRADRADRGDRSDRSDRGGMEEEPGGGDAGPGKAGDPAPGSAEPAAEEPGSDDPAAAEPGSDDPAAEEPGSDDPAAEEPGSDDPAAEEPGSDEPAVDEPATGTAAPEKPGAAEPAAAEPGQDEPGADDPAACAPARPGAPAAPAPTAPTPAPEAYPGAADSAATTMNWGEPNKVDEFDGTELSGWNLYDGEGHAGNGRRSPQAASVKDGILTIDGDAEGTTAGMAWSEGSQKYGRWEGRVRAPRSDPSYNALLLLWPTAENFPVGGEIDFMEMTDHTRETTELFLHHGEDNSQVQGEVRIDATQWHNWAVEWSPEGVVAFVDGKEWWRTDDTSILPPGPMHLCIQLDWFPEGEGEVTPSSMEVDWVRQYPMPESGSGDSGDDGSGDGGSGDGGSGDGGGGADTGRTGGSSGGDTGGADTGGTGATEGLLDGLTELPRRLTEGTPDTGSATRGPSGPSGP